jgi:hypothetical protein
MTIHGNRSPPRRGRLSRQQWLHRAHALETLAKELETEKYKITQTLTDTRTELHSCYQNAGINPNQTPFGEKT